MLLDILAQKSIKSKIDFGKNEITELIHFGKGLKMWQ